MLLPHETWHVILRPLQAKMGKAMLDKHDRWIHYYTASLETVPLGGPRYDIKEAFEKIEAEFAKNLCYKMVDKNTACIRVTHVKFNNNASMVALLMQYSDSNAADPSFSQLKSGKLRQEPKLDGEGIAVSAHIVVNLLPMPGKPLEFLMLLEDVPGIGKTRILPFLNGILKKALVRTFVDPASGKELSCHPILTMIHHTSNSLKQDLEDGELRFIEVSKNDTIADLDEPARLVRSTNIVRVKVAPKLDGDEAVGLINKVRRLYSDKGFEHFKITFKHEEGKIRTVDLSSARQDAADALFGKMEFVKSAEPLPQCSDELNMAFIAQISALK